MPTETDNFIDDEGLENEDDLGIQDPKLYSKAVLWGTDWTTETIVNQLKRKNIDLNPSFQRRDAWDISKKSKFIESLILGLPVPPIILAEVRNKKNSYIVIDGKQRLLSIMQFCSTSNDQEYESLFLKDLKILSDLNDKNYGLLENESAGYDYKNQFDNQAIRTVVIRNWPNEKFLYTVFHRLNTGSLKLSSQELRQALHPGDFLQFVNNYTENQNKIREILKLKKPDSRMRDIELIIRYFAFKNFKNEYKGYLKDFLDNSCEKLNESWKTKQTEIEQQLCALEKAIDFTKEVFGDKNSFSKFVDGEFTNTFNRSIYDIMVYFFSNNEYLLNLNNKKNNILEAFKDVMTNDAVFLSAVGASTKDLEKTKNRYDIWDARLQSIINLE